MAMDIDASTFQLSCELRGHEDDVRGICVCGNSGFATSSRDSTVRLWTPEVSNQQNYGCSKIFLGHSSFVGPLAWIPPSSNKFPEGGIVSGGLDTSVIVWDISTGDKARSLTSHKLQVTGIALDGDDIISCSMDCTLRRWKQGNSSESWEAHSSPIQAVLKLPSGELVTGSTDKTMKLWRGRECVQTFVGHSDTVRGLAYMNELGILSASHDSTVKLWDLNGGVLLEMVGHTSIVYAVDAHSSGLIVSGSEDFTAKLWKDGVCVQTLEHPGCVWDAKFLQNGDVVTACSDGVVRIWTSNQAKFADSDVLRSYSSILSEYKLSRKKVGGISLNELPGLEALQTPGGKNGQTIVVREGDNGVAYSWNIKEYKWDKIGEVVDGPDDGLQGSIHNGKKYDYVFDVDIGDGKPIRKLPYNRSDNPYTVADKWLINENLPLSYRQQIVEFILQNSGQNDVALNPSFRDPFTGANAYVPGENSSRPDVSNKPVFKHIPKKGMLVFDAAQFDGLMKKLTEFNVALQSDPSKADLSLPQVEFGRIVSIIEILKDTSHFHITKFADTDFTLLLRVLRCWPLEMLFPVLDLLRMLVLHPDGAKILLVENSTEALKDVIARGGCDPPVQANLLTSVRAVVNFFKNAIFHEWLLRNRSEILDAYSSCSSSPNKNLRLSYATLILNYAVLLIEKKDEDGQLQVLSAAIEVAEDQNCDVDPKFRACVAIGSLMLDGLVKKIAMDFDVASLGKSLKASKDIKLAEIGADIGKIIS